MKTIIDFDIKLIDEIYFTTAWQMPGIYIEATYLRSLEDNKYKVEFFSN